ncbi:MAG: hypothetical protein ABIG43_00450 [Chloroflexota bacterium]
MDYKKILQTLLASLILGLMLITTNIMQASAQEVSGDYSIHLEKNLGYNAGRDVRGIFSIGLRGDQEDIKQVIFMVNGKEMTTISEAPFKFQFKTDDYGFGWHDLSAEVVTQSGETIVIESVRYNFLSPEEESSRITGLILPIGGVILAAIAISALILVVGKGKGERAWGKPRSYGMMGGTICAKCGHPFPRHIYGLNLLVGRLDRCDSCGNWVMTTRATHEQLAAAEAAEEAAIAQSTEPVAVKDNEADQLEESKYVDSL